MPTSAPLRSPALSVCTAVLAMLAAPAAHAQKFSNSATISIPTSGTASPFPSTITVAGVTGTPSDLTVRLKNFLHTFPADVAVLLVTPSGQGIELLSQSGGGTAVGGVTLTFGADSTAPLPSPLVTGTFAPAGGNSEFFAPADTIPRAASLAALLAGSPNGVWRLFVQDFTSSFGGIIDSGWELEFGLPTASSPLSTFTYQGRLQGGVTTGTINARFSLWSHPSNNAIVNRLAEPVTVSGIAVTNGVFATPVDLGVSVPANIQTWMQVEIASPAGATFAGATFVALTPRQPITAAPLAAVAGRAVFADTATTAVNAINADSAVSATNSVFATNATNATNADLVASGGFLKGALIGPGFITGTSQHDPFNRGIKSRVGYAIVPTGLTEFAGMISSVEPGTNGGGNSADLGFHTWEFATAFSREIMRITGRGNVGIGTSTPGTKLDVAGDLRIRRADKLYFGPENDNQSDPIYLHAYNVAVDNTIFELVLGDNTGGPGNPTNDTFAIVTRSVGGGSRVEQFLFGSDGNAFKRGTQPGWGTISDRRVKHDINDLSGGLDRLLSLRGKTFYYNDPNAMGAAPGQRTGFLAQDVESVFPDWVGMTSDGTKTLTIGGGAFEATTVEAIRELRAEKDRQIDALKADAAKRDAENAELKQRLAAIEAALSQIMKSK